MDQLLPEIETGSRARAPSRRDRALRDIGRGVYITHDGEGAQNVPVPSDAEFFCAFSEGGTTRIEIGPSLATSVSTLVVFASVPLIMYPIAPGQGLSCYGTSTKTCCFRFIGRIYDE